MTTAQATCEIRCRCGQALYALSSEEETVLCLGCGERAVVPRDVRTKAERSAKEKLVTCKGCGQESALPEDTSDGHDCPHCNKTIIYGKPRELPVGAAAGGYDPDNGGSAKNRIALTIAALLLIGLGVLIKIGASTTKPSASGTRPTPTPTTTRPPTFTPVRPPTYQPPPKHSQPIRPPPPRRP